MLGPVEIIFCSSYYDMPLAGLARHQNAFCWFAGDYDTGTYTLYSLDEQAVAEELENKRDFEELVGTHWSFDVPREERVQRARELQAQYYEKHKMQDTHERIASRAVPENKLGEFESFANSLRRY
jgi:hypothetical protein